MVDKKGKKLILKIILHIKKYIYIYNIKSKNKR